MVVAFLRRHQPQGGRSSSVLTRLSACSQPTGLPSAMTATGFPIDGKTTACSADTPSAPSSATPTSLMALSNCRGLLLVVRGRLGRASAAPEPTDRNEANEANEAGPGSQFHSPTRHNTGKRLPQRATCQANRCSCSLRLFPALREGRGRRGPPRHSDRRENVAVAVIT